MKKVIILVVLISAFAAHSFAQTGAQTNTQAAPMTEKTEKAKGKGDKHKGKHEAHLKMQKELGLSADQQKRVKGIGNTYKGKMKAVRSDNTLDKTQKRTQMAEISKVHDAEMKGVLNADQYAKLQEIKKQRHGEMKAHRGGKDKNAPKTN